jgi:hypothetical protein
VNLQFGCRHRNEFGFGLDGLAHGDGVIPGGCCYRQVVASSCIGREDEQVRHDPAAPVADWPARQLSGAIVILPTGKGLCRPVTM